MGLSPQLASAHLRLTLGRSTTQADVERAGDVICREVTALREHALRA
jgi:cysteine sulfinate desulfinase/cysteine desulfurase-like protein